jgi:hypothetical protein
MRTIDCEIYADEFKGVPMRTWNKRAVQGALIRLDQSGMIRRFRLRKKKTDDAWILCIQIQREPRAEDLENLGFRRQAPITDAAEELLHEDGDGDTLMRDLEVDMFDDGDENETNNDLVDDVRIPPQWTPDRLFANIIFDAVALGQAPGWDSVVIRNRIVGPFWRRPMESHLTRLTDDWERTQPPYVRHLAIVRDTRNTEEKKFIHYVYRTYRNFQEAVENGEASWEGVGKPATKDSEASDQTKPGDGSALDMWGFHGHDEKNFVRFNGTATLSEVRSAIANKRKYGPRWDIALAEEIGYQRVDNSVPKPAKFKMPGRPKKAFPGQSLPHESTCNEEDSDDQAGTSSISGKRTISKTPKKVPALSLTPDQRISLGLKPSGRLSKSAAKQILDHRRETGDPESLPDKVVEEPAVRVRAPLMTKEERIALNLPPRGRLGLKQENEIREKRGMPKLVEKGKKRRTTNEPAILTKQQRITLGFKAHGRLHQHFVDALREEQENDVPLDESPAVEAYREFLIASGAMDATPREATTTTAADENVPGPISEAEPDASLDTQPADSESGVSPTENPGKRKPDDLDATPPASKRARTMSQVSEASEGSSAPQPQPPATSVTNTTPPDLPRDSLGNGAATTSGAARPPPKKIRKNAKAVPAVQQAEHPTLPRTSSGLYVYPSAKRKVGRGRPRNACVLLFKTAGLEAFSWFSNDSSSEKDDGQVILGVCKPPPHYEQDQTATGADPGEVADAHMSDRLPSPTEPHTLSDPDTTVPPEPEPPSISSDHPIEEHHSRSQSEARECKQTAAIENVPDDEETPAQPDILHVPTIETASETQELSTVVPQEKPPVLANDGEHTREQSASHVAMAWNAVNASAQITRPAYQSPYAPVTQANATTTHHGPVAASGTQFPTMRLGDPVPEVNSSNPLPQGVVSQIIEDGDATGPSPKKANTKSASVGISGSALKFRREIILEIIDRCGGVFPLHGEIWRPFSAIWDQRHGHTSMAKPQSSTVSDTLKNMILNPEFKLKRMVFHVKARNARGSKERIIVTRSDVSPNDPRVMQLAFNMANHALEKSHQFYPRQIRDLYEYETLYVPVTVAPKDDTITLAQLYPELEYSIKENQIRRRLAKAAQKKAEKAAAKKQNEQVEKAPRRGRPPKARKEAEVHDVQPQVAPRAKRTRLASLNDKNKRYRRAAAPIPALEAVEDVPNEAEAREPSPARSDSSEDIPITTLRPWLVGNIVERSTDYEEVPPSDIDEMTDNFDTNVLDLETVSFTHPIIRFHTKSGTFATFFNLAVIPEVVPNTITSTLETRVPDHEIVTLTHPVVNFHPSSGTFGTSFGLAAISGNHLPSAASRPSKTKAVRKSKNAPKTKKRVRIDDSATQRPRKRPRTSASARLETLDDEFIYSSLEDSDVTSSEDEEEEEDARPKQRQKRKRRIVHKRQLGKNLPVPTLLERLTGLTGDPNDPIYKEPVSRQRTGGPVKPWVERKKKQLNKIRKEREYAETLDHTETFKKLCLTLALAHSMSGDGLVDWSIVEKVYARDKFFNLVKTKKLWTWLQTHMSVQLSDLINNLQTKFLEAYEAGRLPEIDDAESYDWAGLVRWTMRTCTYPELPLPLYREAIDKFVVDESGYANLDRVNWYSKKVADSVRTQLQLQTSFTVPLHQPAAQISESKSKEIKARSWIRANTSTPQPAYDAHLAHEKLKVLGEDILTRVVGDYVQREHLKMRKLKRQLPGRNYTFTRKFAKTYKRLFELEDFMVATTVKKEMDAAFANEDPEKRFYSISRCEEDGSTMAIMSLVGDGKVKLVPRLPPVDNEFGAPLPRLSKWGFCEGDYIHRAIDRTRLFWDIHVVPTSDYRFGNPLEPLPSPAVDWPSLPEPPLPGKHDRDALLPIWSSIDGQSVTWPWWYRILNLVLQPLFLQPGATTVDIQSHCPENATELFEIELVLGWLESVGAVSKLAFSGYKVTSNFWAAFGDRLHDTEDDWFGEHVKRKTKATSKQQWRDKYNLRYSTMQTSASANGPGRKQPNSRNAANGMGRRIVKDGRAQYRILQQALLEPEAEVAQDPQQAPIGDTTTNNFEMAESTHNTEAPAPQVHPTQAQEPVSAVQIQSWGTSLSMYPATVDTDADMIDPDPNEDADAEGEDMDAEGEEDDMDADGDVDVDSEMDVDAEGEEDDTMY